MSATFWTHVDRSSGPDGCWPWLGSKNRDGYGRCKVNRKTKLAHRIAWELLRGAFPAGLVTDHLCRNRACCNPAHMEAVTIGENVRRGLVGRRALVATCCHGHEYDETNTRVGKDGKRYCRACDRERKRRTAKAVA